MSSPILFMVFNRPDVTEVVFSAIRSARPSKLYLAADGPRKSRYKEIDNCKAVIDTISRVDWPCEVHTLFREENLGCKLAISGAIDWFFSMEPEGIILEDDCLPHPDFFRYCHELLEKYRHDDRIGVISGTSFGDLRAEGLISGNEDFIFNRYPSIWGWASWRRVWSQYDVNIKDWKEYRQDISEMTPCVELKKRNDRLFDQVFEKKIDTWDYQVSFLLWTTARLAIAPRLNLIQNIGFGPEATHTKNASQIDSGRIQMSKGRLQFPLVAPKLMVPNSNYQHWLEKYSTRSSFVKILNRLKNYVRG